MQEAADKVTGRGLDYKRTGGKSNMYTRHLGVWYFLCILLKFGFAVQVIAFSFSFLSVKDYIISYKRIQKQAEDNQMKIIKLVKPLQLQEISKKPKKRRAVIFCVLLLAILLAAVAGRIFLKGGGEKTDFPFGDMQRQNGNVQFTMSEGMVMASGVTSVGVTEEVFEVENLTAELEIEEVYVNSEDIVGKGTKVLKLSESSVAEARKELEQALKEADLAYRSGLIEYEQSKITAKYDLDSKVLSGEQAKEVYDEAVSRLQDSVDQAREELAKAQEEIAEYRSYVDNDAYKSYFKVDEYQEIYDETLEALKEKMDEWGVSWSQVTGQSGMNIGGGQAPASGGDVSGRAVPDGTVSGGDASGTAVSGGTVSGGDASNGIVSDGTASDSDAVQSTSPSRDQIEVLATLYNVLEMQLKKLEQAETDYESALVNGAFELQTLELKLPELEKALEEAEKNYQTQILQAKLTYEKTMSNADSAQGDYETAIQQAQTTYEALEKNRKDAEENLELFESSVGDGYFYASGEGTVLRTMVRAGRNLTAESTVFMYSNPEEMTVTVSVGQEDIGGIALEDKVYILSNEYGEFEGIVAKVDPISDSDSRTNVAYSVVIELIGDTAAVPANESVTVVFGMETPSWGGGMPQEGDIPEGGKFPQNGNGQMRLPQGSDSDKENPRTDNGGRHR
ncbi:HlyD family efflux transporter periplasmic adaptor subunit [bacterium D16-50]|nr:HlyD family efflux transporter periplasmic adaptor subunit [bacterium D16-50]